MTGTANIHNDLGSVQERVNSLILLRITSVLPPMFHHHACQCLELREGGRLRENAETTDCACVCPRLKWLLTIYTTFHSHGLSDSLRRLQLVTSRSGPASKPHLPRARVWRPQLTIFVRRIAERQSEVLYRTEEEILSST